MAIDFAPTNADERGRRLRLLRHRPGSVDRAARRGPVRPADAGRRHGVLRRPVRGEQRRRSSRSVERRDVRARRGRRRVRRRTHDPRSTCRSRPSAATTGSSTPAMVVGLFGPSDWAPDEGHGTIEPFVDAAVAEPSRRRPARSRPGASQDGHAPPRRRRRSPPASTTRWSSSSRTRPKQTQLPVDVTLTVTLPPEFGAISGTVTDAHTGEPLAGVSVAVHATWHGAPLDLTATTGRRWHLRRSSGRPGRGRAVLLARRLRQRHPPGHDRRRASRPPASTPPSTGSAACQPRRGPADVRPDPGPDRAARPSTLSQPRRPRGPDVLDRRGQPRPGQRCRRRRDRAADAAGRQRTRQARRRSVITGRTALAVPPATPRRRRRPRELERRA